MVKSCLSSIKKCKKACLTYSDTHKVSIAWQQSTTVTLRKAFVLMYGLKGRGRGHAALLPQLHGETTWSGRSELSEGLRYRQQHQ